LARLAGLRLLRRYSLMAAFCGLQVAGAVAGVFLVSEGFHKAYWYSFVAIQIPLWTLAACIVVDTHNRAVEEFKGFHRLGQLLIWLGLGLSAVWVTGITLFTSSEELVGARDFLNFQERNVFFALLGLAILVGIFVEYFRLDPVWNVKIVYLTMLALFVGNAATWGARVAYDAEWGQAIELVSILWHVACLGLGAVLFSAAGEEPSVPSASDGPSTAVDEAVVLGRLEAINSSLLRVLRS